MRFTSGFGMALAAAFAGIFTLGIQDGWLQIAPLAAISLVVLVVLYLANQWTGLPDQAIDRQVLLSICIYWVVWIGASGIKMAREAGTAIEPWRVAGLVTASGVLMLGFYWILIRMAAISGDQKYCLGLAMAILAAGLLVFFGNPRLTYPVIHAVMALGFLIGAAIQIFHPETRIPNLIPRQDLKIFEQDT